MFEVAELKNRITKQQYDREVSELRTQLLDVQQKLEIAGLPVVVLIAGVDGAGKGDLINTLNEWFDPRYMCTHAFSQPSDEERERPHHWRYWMSLPPRGRIGVYAIGWYGPPMADRVYDRIGNAKLDAELVHINKLEKELADDGMLIVKCWLHLSKKQQENLIQKLEKDPETRWRVSDVDRKHLKLYKKFVGIAERVLRETSTGEAPWLIINGYDQHYRRLTIANHLIERISARLEAQSNGFSSTAALQQKPTLVNNGPSLLSSLNPELKLGKSDYQERLALCQGRISQLTRRARQRKVSTIMVFEGWDAAGKGGVIRRITQALDARNYRVIPVAAPTDEEKSHHYLWRFWRHLPRDGKVTIYDRSWYGRVLVERVENLAKPEEWARAYSEINDFEEELTDHGIILVKYWMHISKDEQLKRFKEREKTSYKRYKITEEDHRNREKWDLYEAAVNEMITRTSTEYAPWRVIEANNKYYGRIRVLKSLCDAYESQLGG